MSLVKNGTLFLATIVCNHSVINTFLRKVGKVSGSDLLSLTDLNLYYARCMSPVLTASSHHSI